MVRRKSPPGRAATQSAAAMPENLSLQEWTLKVCEALAEFGFMPEKLPGVRWAQLWRKGVAPRTAAILALKAADGQSRAPL